MSMASGSLWFGLQRPVKPCPTVFAGGARTSKRSPLARRSRGRPRLQRSFAQRWPTRSSALSSSHRDPRCADSSGWAVPRTCPRSRSGRARPAAREGAASQSSLRRMLRACRAWPTPSRGHYRWRTANVRELLRTRTVAIPEGERRGGRRRVVLAADVCLCEYPAHGHGGVLDGDRIDNDATLPLLADAATAYAEAGADVVAPSAMMDGQVAALRAGLDAGGFQGTAIIAYASKHASVFYGPFREAAGSTPGFGDRKSYHLDPANGREAIRELDLDASEGADILMVKPAITSLDLLAMARSRFDLPLAAYQVSGEAAMIEAAAERGWIDRRGAVLETLTSIVRAGANAIATYFPPATAPFLNETP